MTSIRDRQVHSSCSVEPKTELLTDLAHRWSIHQRCNLFHLQRILILNNKRTPLSCMQNLTLSTSTRLNNVSLRFCKSPDPVHAELVELELLSIGPILVTIHAIPIDRVHDLQTLSLCSKLDHAECQHLVDECSSGHESGCFLGQWKVAE